MTETHANTGELSNRASPTSKWRLIGVAYVVVILFIALFFLFLTETARLSSQLRDPRWSLLFAIILVLPLLLPAFLHLARYVKSVKISDFQVSFAQVEVARVSLASLA